MSAPPHAPPPPRGPPPRHVQLAGSDAPPPPAPRPPPGRPSTPSPSAGQAAPPPPRGAPAVAGNVSSPLPPARPPHGRPSPPAGPAPPATAALPVAAVPTARPPPSLPPRAAPPSPLPPGSAGLQGAGLLSLLPASSAGLMSSSRPPPPRGPAPPPAAVAPSPARPDGSAMVPPATPPPRGPPPTPASPGADVNAAPLPPARAPPPRGPASPAGSTPTDAVQPSPRPPPGAPSSASPAAAFPRPPPRAPPPTGPSPPASPPTPSAASSTGTPTARPPPRFPPPARPPALPVSSGSEASVDASLPPPMSEDGDDDGVPPPPPPAAPGPSPTPPRAPPPRGPSPQASAPTHPAVAPQSEGAVNSPRPPPRGPPPRGPSPSHAAPATPAPTAGAPAGSPSPRPPPPRGPSPSPPSHPLAAQSAVDDSPSPRPPPRGPPPRGPSPQPPLSTAGLEVASPRPPPPRGPSPAAPSQPVSARPTPPTAVSDPATAPRPPPRGPSPSPPSQPPAVQSAVDGAASPRPPPRGPLPRGPSPAAASPVQLAAVAEGGDAPSPRPPPPRGPSPPASRSTEPPTPTASPSDSVSAPRPPARGPPPRDASSSPSPPRPAPQAGAALSSPGSLTPSTAAAPLDGDLAPPAEAAQGLIASLSPRSGTPPSVRPPSAPPAPPPPPVDEPAPPPPPSAPRGKTPSPSASVGSVASEHASAGPMLLCSIVGVEGLVVGPKSPAKPTKIPYFTLALVPVLNTGSIIDSKPHTFVRSPLLTPGYPAGAPVTASFPPGDIVMQLPNTLPKLQARAAKVVLSVWSAGDMSVTRPADVYRIKEDTLIGAASQPLADVLVPDALIKFDVGSQWKKLGVVKVLFGGGAPAGTSLSPPLSEAAPAAPSGPPSAVQSPVASPRVLSPVEMMPEPGGVRVASPAAPSPPQVAPPGSPPPPAALSLSVAEPTPQQVRSQPVSPTLPPAPVPAPEPTSAAPAPGEPLEAAPLAIVEASEELPAPAEPATVKSPAVDVGVVSVRPPSPSIVASDTDTAPVSSPPATSVEAPAAALVSLAESRPAPPPPGMAVMPPPPPRKATQNGSAVAGALPPSSQPAIASPSGAVQVAAATHSPLRPSPSHDYMSVSDGSPLSSPASISPVDVDSPLVVLSSTTSPDGIAAPAFVPPPPPRALPAPTSRAVATSSETIEAAGPPLSPPVTSVFSLPDIPSFTTSPVSSFSQPPTTAPPSPTIIPLPVAADTGVISPSLAALSKAAGMLSFTPAPAVSETVDVDSPARSPVPTTGHTVPTVRGSLQAEVQWATGLAVHRPCVHMQLRGLVQGRVFSEHTTEVGSVQPDGKVMFGRPDRPSKWAFGFKATLPQAFRLDVRVCEAANDVALASGSLDVTDAVTQPHSQPQQVDVSLFAGGHLPCGILRIALSSIHSESPLLSRLEFVPTPSQSPLHSSAHIFTMTVALAGFSDVSPQLGGMIPPGLTYADVTWALHAELVSSSSGSVGGDTLSGFAVRNGSISLPLPSFTLELAPQRLADRRGEYHLTLLLCAQLAGSSERVLGTGRAVVSDIICTDTAERRVDITLGREDGSIAVVHCLVSCTTPYSSLATHALAPAPVSSPAVASLSLLELPEYSPRKPASTHTKISSPLAGPARVIRSALVPQAGAEVCVSVAELRKLPKLTPSRSQGVYVKLFCESESGEVTGCLRTSTVSTNTRAPSWEVTPNESMLTIYQPDSNLVVEVWTETSGVDGDLVASAVMPGYSIVQQSKREVECPLEAPSGDFGGVAILRLSSPFPAGRSPAASQTVSGTLLLSLGDVVWNTARGPQVSSPTRGGEDVSVRITARDAGYMPLCDTVEFRMVDRPSAVPLPYSLPAASLCANGVLLVTVEVVRDGVAVCAELNVTQSAGDTFCEREVTCSLFPTAGGDRGIAVGHIDFCISGCVGEGDAEPARSGIVSVKPLRLKGGHKSEACFMEVQLLDVGPIPLSACNTELTAPVALTAKPGWRSASSGRSVIASSARPKGVLHWDKAHRPLALQFGVTSPDRPLRLLVKGFSVGADGSQDCIGEGMFDVTPCLWSPCAPSERSCVITGSAGTSEFHFMLSSQLTHSVDLPRAPSRCSSIFVEFISGELLDKIPGARTSGVSMKLSLESPLGVRYGELSLGSLSPPPSLGQLWLLAQDGGAEFPIVSDALILRVLVSCPEGSTVTGTVDVTDLVWSPTEPFQAAISLTADDDLRSFGRVHLMLSSLHPDSDAKSRSRAGALAPLMSHHIQLDVTALSVHGLVVGGAPRSPKQRERGSGIGSCAVRALMGVAGDSLDVSTEEAATTDSVSVSVDGEGLWKTGSTVTLGTQVTDADRVCVRLEVVTPVIAGSPTKGPAPLLVAATVTVFVPREVLVLPGYHRRIVASLEFPGGERGAGVIQLLLRRSVVDATTPGRVYASRHRVLRVLSCEFLEAEVSDSLLGLQPYGVVSVVDPTHATITSNRIGVGVYDYGSVAWGADAGAGAVCVYAGEARDMNTCRLEVFGGVTGGDDVCVGVAEVHTHDLLPPGGKHMTLPLRLGGRAVGKLKANISCEDLSKTGPSRLAARVVSGTLTFSCLSATAGLAVSLEADTPVFISILLLDAACREVSRVETQGQEVGDGELAWPDRLCLSYRDVPHNAVSARVLVCERTPQDFAVLASQEVSLGDLIGIKACQAYDVDMHVNEEESGRIASLSVKFVIASALLLDEFVPSEGVVVVSVSSCESVLIRPGMPAYTPSRIVFTLVCVEGDRETVVSAGHTEERPVRELSAPWAADSGAECVLGYPLKDTSSLQLRVEVIVKDEQPLLASAHIDVSHCLGNDLTPHQQTASLVDESSGADRGRLVLSISSLTGVSAVARRATHAARRLELAHVSIAQVSDELERLRVASSVRMTQAPVEAQHVAVDAISLVFSPQVPTGERMRIVTASRGTLLDAAVASCVEAGSADVAEELLGSRDTICQVLAQEGADVQAALSAAKAEEKASEEFVEETVSTRLEEAQCELLALSEAEGPLFPYISDDVTAHQANRVLASTAALKEEYDKELPTLYREAHDLERLVERFRSDALLYQKQKAGVGRDMARLREAVETALASSPPVTKGNTPAGTVDETAEGLLAVLLEARRRAVPVGDDTPEPPDSLDAIRASIVEAKAAAELAGKTLLLEAQAGSAAGLRALEDAAQKQFDAVVRVFGEALMKDMEAKVGDVQARASADSDTRRELQYRIAGAEHELKAARARLASLRRNSHASGASRAGRGASSSDGFSFSAAFLGARAAAGPVQAAVKENATALEEIKVALRQEWIRHRVPVAARTRFVHAALASAPYSHTLHSMLRRKHAELVAMGTRGAPPPLSARLAIAPALKQEAADPLTARPELWEFLSPFKTGAARRSAPVRPHPALHSTGGSVRPQPQPAIPSRPRTPSSAFSYA